MPTGIHSIFPGSGKTGVVEGKPTTGLPPGTVVKTVEVVGDPVRRAEDREYKEWEDSVIKHSIPVPDAEVERGNPIDHLPEVFKKSPPATFGDNNDKLWVWNECNNRWWTVDEEQYIDINQKYSDLGTQQVNAILRRNPGALRYNELGLIQYDITWTTFDGVTGQWIRRTSKDWCKSEDPTVPPVDDCIERGINCPEPVGSGKVYTRIDDVDKLPLRTEVITYGMWTGGIGNLTTFYTCSMAAASQSYHWVVYNNECSTCNSQPQFDLAYGHDGGSGSTDLGGYDYLTPTNAIYGQYRLICLDANQRRFKIGNTELEDIYVINVRQSLMGDRVDEGNLELNLAHLSGSEYVAGGNLLRTHTGSNVSLAGNGQVLRLIDDSRLYPSIDLHPDAFTSSYTDVSGSKVHAETQAGKVFKMVSGSLEQGIYNKSNPKVYGLFYPYLGIIVLNANKLDSDASFGTVTNTEVAGNNAEKLFLAISGAAQYTDASGDTLGFQARRKEIQHAEHFFIRVKNADYNFSNNPTFMTGSEGAIHDNFVNDPKVYFTSIGLYNERKELIAVGKVSRAIQKTCTSEALFNVKLKY